MADDQETPEQRLARLEGQGETPEARLAKIQATVEPSQIHRLAQKPGGMARLKKNIAEQNAAGRPSLGEKIVGTADAAAQQIPFVEGVGRDLRAAIHGGTPAENLAQMRTAQEETPASLTVPATALGMATTAPLAAPFSAAKGGALIAGSLAAGNPDEQSVPERLGKTALAAGGGALMGKVLEALGTVDAAQRSPTLGKIATDIDKARSAASKPLYKAFRDTPYTLDGPEAAPLKELMDLPLVKSALTLVKGQSPTLNKLPDLDPRVVDALYKKVGDKAFKMAGYESDEAREALKNAIETAVKPLGGSYKAALTAFKEPSQELGAVTRGAQWLDRSVKKSPVGAKAAQKLVEDSPEAIKGEFAAADPALQGRMLQGVVARMKELPKSAHLEVLGTRVPTGAIPSKALRKTMDLLRNSNSPFARLLNMISGAAGGEAAGNIVNP